MYTYQHPKFFDANQIRTVYYEIMGVLEEWDRDSFGLDDRELSAAIIRKLTNLFTEGTPPQDWKSKVLSSLPLR